MLNVARGAEMFALREKGQSCICQEIGEAVTLLESGMAIASEFEHRELCITSYNRGIINEP